MSLLLDALNKSQRQSSASSTSSLLEDVAQTIAGSVDLSDVPDLDIDTYTDHPKRERRAGPATTEQAELPVDLIDSEHPRNEPSFDPAALSLEPSQVHSEKNNTSDPTPASARRQSIHDGVLADLEADLQRLQSPAEELRTIETNPAETAPLVVSTPVRTRPTPPSPIQPHAPQTESPRAFARRLFTAKSPRHSRQRQLIYMIAAVAIVGLLAGAAYVYTVTQERQTPMTRAFVPPAGVSATPASDVVSSARTVNSAGTTLLPLTPEQTAETATTTNANNPPAPIHTLPPSADVSNKTEHNKFSEEQETEESELGLPDFNAVAQPELPSTSVPPRAAQEHPITPVSPAIRITRGTAAAQVNTLVAQAYSAFQNGDWQTAVDHYQNALRQDPNNRDALLGLATIAAFHNNVPLARTHYMKLLQLNANDAVAIAGLQSIAPTVDTANGESELKSLIARTPGVAFLHFSLGNVYVQQQRWPDAERAFFEAYRQDKNRPDYAYNLAVALDHLGQTSPALHYYETALSLAAIQPATFDVAGAKQRTAELRRTAGVNAP